MWVGTEAENLICCYINFYIMRFISILSFLQYAEVHLEVRGFIVLINSECTSILILQDLKCIYNVDGFNNTLCARKLRCYLFHCA